jgi:imidazolonepropionase-like amidohydrolase
MIRFLCAALPAALVLLVAGPLVAQDRPIAFEGALVHPIAGPPIENGVVLVRDGRIQAVGPAGSVRIPADADRRDVRGRVILPGLVDTHSHIGGGDGGDRSAAMHPAVRILDTIDPGDDRIHRARAGGITTVNVMPGSGHLLSGQTVYLKLRQGRIINDLLFCGDPLRDICGGIKMANGTNPRRPAPFPGTRARASAMVRERLVAAEEYREKIRAAGGDAAAVRPRDLELEALVEALEGRRIVHHHTHRHDDILAVLRLQEEFGFRGVLHHVSEAWMVADEIAASGMPSSIILLDSPGGKLEAAEIRWENGAALERVGAPVAFHTDDGVTDSRLFLRMAAFGVRAGMSRERALEALTIEGARQMDLEDRVGTLEPGKDADLVILSGDPFSVYTQVLETWVEGQRVWNRADPRDYRFAVGGYGLDHHDFDQVRPPAADLPAAPQEDPR